jgi:hypothetical protein
MQKTRKTLSLQATVALLLIKATITMKLIATLRTSPKLSFPPDKTSQFKIAKKKTKNRNACNLISRYLAM